MVKLEGFTSQKNEILLAEHLRGILAVEPQILAKADGDDRVRSLERKSAQSYDRNFCFKFVEMEDVKDFCPKHSHMRV